MTSIQRWAARLLGLNHLSGSLRCHLRSTATDRLRKLATLLRGSSHRAGPTRSSGVETLRAILNADATRARNFRLKRRASLKCGVSPMTFDCEPCRALG